MALSAASGSARMPVLRAMAQALSGVRMASTNEPTYTYMPPGSSMREPLYFNISVSDPVYFVDPKPDTLPAAAASASATAMMQQQANAFSAEEKAAIAQQQQGPGQQQPQQPSRPVLSTPGPTSLPKVDLSHIMHKKGDDGRPVSYRMADDMAQVPYVTNAATHSMREPKYVSVSEPGYLAGDGKTKQAGKK